MNRIADLPKDKAVKVLAHTPSGSLFETSELFASIEFAVNFLTDNALTNRVYQIVDSESDEPLSAYLKKPTK